MDLFLFAILPYLALVVAIIGSIHRYRTNKFTVSSLSSEFLEGKKLFWGSVPFHWGLIFLFFGHLIAFLVPRSVLLWNSHPVRLLILEVSAFAFGLSVLFGLLAFIYRRLSNDRIRSVTSTMDIALLAILLVQVVSGLYIAYAHRWGSSWFASVLTPYLWSVFALKPDISAVSAMPWMIKLHIASAYSIFFLIPFTRLMHVLVVPFPYLWRSYQKVVWNRNRRTIRSPYDNPIYKAKPKNN